MHRPVWNRFSLAHMGPARVGLARIGTRAVLWLLACSMGACALGQDGTPEVPDDQADTPDEVAPDRVARLSFTQGGVTLQAVGETAWAPATVNRPLTPGDFLRTENDGRAEVQVGSADIRMGAGTSFAFTALDDDAMRMRLSVGVLNLRVRALGENEAIEIETPQATASILRPGSYRLEVSPDGGATVVKVSSGLIEARGSGDQSFVVRPQQVATLTGTTHLAFTTATLGAPDAFDQWALERDRRDDYALSTEASRNVPADIVGYQDLENYGTWSSEPDYGYVWTPSNVGADWSPYRFGRYTYVSGWGWAWIDNTPWGFAPYHYGSWVTIGNRWCWVPGPRHGRPVGGPSGGGPIAGQPSQPPHHGWHVPRPPRGYTVRSGVPPSEVGRIGTRPGFASNGDGDRRQGWRGERDGRDVRDSRNGRDALDRRDGLDGRGARDARDGTRNDGSRFRTVPDPVPSASMPDNRRVQIPRYETPRNPRNDARNYTPPAASPPAGSASPTSPPPVSPLPRTSPPPPRAEIPRPSGPGFIRGAPSPSQPQSRPTPPPAPPPPPPRPVQAQPAPAQPAQSQGGRNGGNERSVGGRPRTLER